ncbi:hypothetical protein SPRG_20188 [Saprolegnia parasitica CBS 223.65]|uniref:B-block binding subunit of TFIIIC domain-containing protein n=1 Tax=Saprolegnia parasitica (strain CBS 223.65) TaxID=695850 RepID=A0A067CMG9_SAPPC|nr:hypothetical protein SPRG_20188 [Saprolegnia parasitica CBS 223.65]KDO28027.1 hypothetical protein SPRG_20188 [Saprolegnia parasitica CBS 223.65]|eukprot:XP_012201181.1 hypothetical protein SPRG_20188 [Saprolegnia parasitica CBS 223.65]
MTSALRLTPHLIEAVALEGRCGISLRQLLERHESSGDAAVRAACWRVLRASGLLPPHPIAFFADGARLTDVPVALADALDIVIVASEDLRLRALHVTPSGDLPPTQLLILETVGRTRAKGISMMDLTTAVSEAASGAKKVKSKTGDIRAVHHQLDRLLSLKLVVKKMLQILGQGRPQRFNVILLARFANDFDHEALFPGAILEDDLAWKQRTVIEMLQYMSTHNVSQCVLADAVRGTIADQKYKLEAFKNYIIAEGQRQASSFPVEIFSAIVGTDTKRKLWCVKRRQIELEPDPFPGLPRLGLESGVMYQIHQLIQISEGITTPEIRSLLEIPGPKTTYRLLSTATSAYAVRMTKVVVGRNSVFKLFPMAPDITAPKRKRDSSCDEDDVEDVKPEPERRGTWKRPCHGHSLKRNSAAMDAPTDDTASLRKEHIAARVAKERIVSLYSLRSSIIEMENFHEGTKNIQFIAGHRVDTRSIQRLLDSLQGEGHLEQRAVAYPSRRPLCPLDAYLARYSRDTRVQRLNTKAFTNPRVAVRDGRLTQIDPSAIKYMMKAKLHSVHKADLARTKQSRSLGLCHGMMHRCRVFHRLLFEYLHTTTTAASSKEDALATLLKQASTPAAIVFSLDAMLAAMRVRQYIGIFGIGHVLTPDEYTTVERALAADVTLYALDDGLRRKVTYRQTRRCLRLLNMLKSLQLVSTYRLRLEQLLQHVHADDNAKRNDDVEVLLRDQAEVGRSNLLLVWHTHGQLLLDDSAGVWATESIGRVIATRHQYSFGHAIPLRMDFTDVDKVDLYWEALQCVALESLSFAAGPGQVQAFPKPLAFSHVNLLVPISWTSRTQSERYKKRKAREKELRAIIPGSSRVPRPRRRSPYTKPRLVKAAKCRVAVEVDHVDFTPDEENELLEAYYKQLEANWRVSVPEDMQCENESVLVRAPHAWRVNFSVATIGRALRRSRPPSAGPLRRRLAELLDQVSSKQALVDLHNRVFGQSVFVEEDAVMTQPRMTALLNRVLMIVLCPDTSYLQMAAEHLLLHWTRREINTVWRLLWLRGWIVHATAPTHRQLQRGYVLSRKLLMLWRDGARLPLSMFEEAAEQAAVVDDALEDADDNEDGGVQLTVGAPLTHAAFVLGRCSFLVEYKSSTVRGSSAIAHKRKRPQATDRAGFGIAGHLYQLQPQDDPWVVSTIFSHPPPEQLSDAMDAFTAPLPLTKKARRTFVIDDDAIHGLLGAAAEQGCSAAELALALDVDAIAVREKLESMSDDVLCVQAYAQARYVLRSYEKFWTVQSYVVAPNNEAIFDTKSPGKAAHPWLKLSGSTNVQWWTRMQRSALHFIFGAPGADDVAVWKHMDMLLPLQQVRCLLAHLVAEDVLYARVAAKQPSTLFSVASPVVGVPDAPLTEIDLDEWTVRYMAPPDCIEKLGMLLRDTE